jgi:predicted dehydrogenase
MTMGRIGLVGFGTGGRWFHAPLIASVDTAEFVGVVTGSPERRAILAEEYPGVAVFDDVEALLHAGVDLVTVSIPPEGREDVVRRVIDAGVAVVVDKPFALNPDAGVALVDYADERGVPITVFHNRRWDSESLTIARLRDEGTVGDIHLFESAIERWEPNSGNASTGGGYLADLGSHLVDQATWLFGSATHVWADIYHAPGYASEVGFMLALTHSDGVVSHLFGHCLQPAGRPRMRLSGSGGVAVIDDLDIQTDQVFAGQSPRTLGDGWGVEPPARRVAFYSGEHVAYLERDRGRWDEFYPAALRAVLDGHPMPVDARQAVNTLRVIQAARVSSELRRVIELP